MLCKSWEWIWDVLDLIFARFRSFEDDRNETIREWQTLCWYIWVAIRQKWFCKSYHYKVIPLLTSSGWSSVRTITSFSPIPHYSNYAVSSYYKDVFMSSRGPIPAFIFRKPKNINVLPSATTVIKALRRAQTVKLIVNYAGCQKTNESSPNFIQQTGNTIEGEFQPTW